MSTTPAWAVSFDEAVDGIVKQLDKNPAGLRSLAVRGLHEDKTLARWPFSDRMEEAISGGLASSHPSFAILNLGLARKMKAGKDGVLTGTYKKEGRKIRLALQLQDERSEKTLYALKPLEIEDVEALPEFAFGKLVVDVDNPRALVFVDGKPMGEGSRVLPLPLGSHLLTVVHEGFNAYDAPIEIQADRSSIATIRLARQVSKARFEANLPGVKVTVDGKERGNTPLILEDLSAGKHKIIFSKLGCRDVAQTHEIESGKTQLFKAELLMLPGKLVVSSDVPDATVELDGHPVGKTPLLIPEVGVGTHKLRVTAAGYAPYEQEIPLSSDQTLSIRTRLSSPSMEDESGFQTLALLPASRSREDQKLLEDVLRNLPKDLVTVPDRRTIDRFLPDEASVDSIAIKKLAHSLKAKKVVFLGLENFSPFQRVAGLWPKRPSLAASIETYASNGARREEKRLSTLEGGEPWGFGDKAPAFPELSEQIAVRLASELSGEPQAEKVSINERGLLNKACLLFGNDRFQTGFDYERRVFPALGLGLGYLYSNALGNDRKEGTALPADGPGDSLIYGVGQAHQLRCDLLLHPDAQVPARAGEVFISNRWAPFVGAGYRLKSLRYEVFGAGSKDSQGGFSRTQHQGVVLAGLDLNLGGFLARAEAEVPIITRNGDPAPLAYTFGAGRLF